jgi:predicted nuclease of restriction endonuclease-like (RecB) superfamily
MDKNTYNNWLREIKEKIRLAQIKSAIQVNTTLIQLYWDIGAIITDKQAKESWGTKIIEQIAIDLKKEFPDTSGFSRSNLFSMRKFYKFYAHSNIIHQLGGFLKQKSDLSDNQTDTIVHQLGGQLSLDNLLLQIPWRHHVLILNKCNSVEEAIFHIVSAEKTTIFSVFLMRKLQRRGFRNLENQ